MNILFLSRWFPWPPDNGAKIRIFNLLRCLSAENTIDLISFAESSVENVQVAPLLNYCRSVRAVPYKKFQPNRLKAILGLLNSKPRSVIDTDNVQLRQEISLLLRENSYDIVIASQVDMAPYCISIPRHSARIRVLEEIEISTLLEQKAKASGITQKFRKQLMWGKWARYLSKTLSQFDAYTVVSDLERSRLSENLEGIANLQLPVRIIPNGVDTLHYSAINISPNPDYLIYSGALSFGANFDAVSFFLNQILPIVVDQHPSVKFRVTGSTHNVSLEKLPSSSNLEFTGYLQDIRPAIAESWISVVPLRIGGGTRLKILESMALGTPVVATSKGAEGLDLVSGRDIIIADNPLEFAESILGLIRNPQLRMTISENGRKAIKPYDWSTIGSNLAHFLKSL